MNSNVHPAVVILVLALTSVAIVTWMWASNEVVSIGGPAEIRTDRSGHAYVQIQGFLIEHDADGMYLQTHDMSDLDVELFLGTFDFFSNGDVLLRRGPDPRSFGDNIRAFQRKTNDQSIQPESADSGLFRCDLDSYTCAQFGDGVDFKAAFGVFIDRRTDEALISDTTRHLIRKYSADGVELASPVGGFKFPNQLLVHEDVLYIADTNNHVVREVDPSTTSFGLDFGRRNVVPAQAMSAYQTWPSHIARVGDGWWVNNMRSGMNQGGIYAFDSEWQFTKKIVLPEDADPISILAVGDSVWVSDWNGDKVRRFSFAGEPLTDLDSAGLAEILAASRADRRKYETLKYAGVALFILILAGLLLRGVIVSNSNTAGGTSDHARQADSLASSEPVYLEPDAKVMKKNARALRMVTFIMIAIAVLLGALVLASEKAEVGLELGLAVGGLVLVFALITWVHRANKGTFVRIESGLLTLCDHTGRESTCPIRDVRYDDMTIATPDAVVFLGRPPSTIYNRALLDEMLFPRLGEAEKVSPLQMQKIMFKLRHPQSLLAVLTLIALAIYVASTFGD